MKFYMSKIQNCCLSGAVLLALFFVSAVRAEMLTYQFEGEISYVDRALEGGFSVGDSFMGTYTIDSDSPLRIWSYIATEPYYEDYYVGYRDNAVSSMSFSSGAVTASASSGEIRIDYTEDFRYEQTVFPIEMVSAFPGNSSFILSQIWIDSAIFWEYLSWIPLPQEYDRFQFSFRTTSGSVESVRGALNSVALVGKATPTIAVADNTWVQIGLNTRPPVGSTVADIIGDDMPDSYNYDTYWQGNRV